MFEQLAGIYAASLTPLNDDFTPALEDVILLLDFLAGRGCHGALLFGTTGEGPSFAVGERLVVMQEAVKIRQSHPNFRLLAGTGTPSLEETLELTRAAFGMGFDGAVVLPPYYYSSASDEGLYAWYGHVIESAVPPGAALLGYHIPAMSGVSLSIELLIRLKKSYPERFAGIKDSSGDPDHARKLGETFGNELLTLSGNDRLLSHALLNSASGCITALANLCSPDLRLVWDANQRGESDKIAQTRLDANRDILERYLPAPPLLKSMLARLHNLPRWALKPPLLPLSTETETQAAAEFTAIE